MFLSVIHEPSGKAYKSLIHYYCKRADAFMLVMDRRSYFSSFNSKIFGEELLKSADITLEELREKFTEEYITEIYEKVKDNDYLFSLTNLKKLEKTFDTVDSLKHIIIENTLRFILFNEIEIFEKNSSKFAESLEKYLIKQRHNPEWPGTKVFDDEGMMNDQYTYDINFYSINPYTKEKLLSINSLYSWKYPYYPQDLAFFKNGKCLLASTAHEEMCEIYCEDEEEYNYLKSIGIEFLEDKFIPTPQDELYYEEY